MLQGARSATIYEANGRLSHYLSAMGSGVVAMAFVSNVFDLLYIFRGHFTHPGNFRYCLVVAHNANWRGLCPHHTGNKPNPSLLSQYSKVS